MTLLSAKNETRDEIYGKMKKKGYIGTRMMRDKTQSKPVHMMRNREVELEKNRRNQMLEHNRDYP